MTRRAAPLLPASPLPRPLGELLDLLERISEASDGALAALRRGELDAVPALIEQRGSLLSLTGPLLQEVQHLKERAGAVSPAALGAVREAGHRVRAAEEELTGALALARADLSSRLDRMSRAAAARSAYSPDPLPPR